MALCAQSPGTPFFGDLGSVCRGRGLGGLNIAARGSSTPSFAF
jgi:hypothetical protein